MPLPEKDERVVCYLGHEDCYDRHEAERLSDEADWAADADADADDYWSGWDAISISAVVVSGEEQS